MALPLPISKINRIMTADKHWKAAGMGATDRDVSGRSGQLDAF